MDFQRRTMLVDGLTTGYLEAGDGDPVVLSLDFRALPEVDDNPDFAIRIALIPVVAGISYEIIRLSAKKEGGWFFKLITKPGVWLQNVTTKEPDDDQLEVAIEALKESLKLEPKPADPVLAPLS